MPRFSKNMLVYLLILVAMVTIFFTVVSPGGGAQHLKTLDLINRLKERGGEVTIKGTTMTALIDGQKYDATIPEDFDANVVFKPEVEQGKIAYDYQNPSNWAGVLIGILPFLFFGALILFFMRQAQGGSSQAMSFGRSRARMFSGDKPTVTFADVAGVEEAKQELHEVVEFLKFPEKFLGLGARIPRGVLLVGPPGTGKTLMARAVAGEAGVPFFSISGSEFVEMFVGVGASRVRDLFDQAKRNAPCIIFVDEIDAVGRHRGAGVGGGHDEREQTLNQILVEMDGFDTQTNVIVISATNRPDILDPALLRPGRFDRRVVLDQPDVNGRTAILKVHARGKPLDTDVDLEVISKQTAGFSGADLSNLVNEAAILAARRSKKVIGMTELEESIDRVMLGPERKSRVISQKEKEITAYHEAGHALVARLTAHADPVHKVSIVARGMAGGYTKQLPTEDRHLYTPSQLKARLATMLGGRSAEEIMFNEGSTGAQSDLETATDVARRMIKEFGMSQRPQFEQWAISTFVDQIAAGNVEAIEVYGNDLVIRAKDGRSYASRKEQDFSVVEYMGKHGANGIKVTVKDATSLGGLGPRTFGKREELVFLGRMVDEQKDYGDKISNVIDEEIRALIDEAHNNALSILTQNKGKLVQIAERLIADETLEGEKLESLFNSEVPAPAAAPSPS